MRNILTLSLAMMAAISASASEADTIMTADAPQVQAVTEMPAMAMAGTTLAEADDAVADNAEGKKWKQILGKVDPSIKFGGYIIGKYSISDQAGTASNGGFDLRFIRLYANGYCFKDFYYRIQMEVNGAPGDDKGPRVVDAFVEWQHFNAFRVKLGQFKRSFGFENPYSPLNVGLGSYSQATMKLASISDRIGEHKSSGRDVGLQVQGDLFPSKKDGHTWLHYQVGFFNGQGINHADKDNHKDLIGGLWFCPVKNLEIGGFGWNGKYTNESYKGDGTDLKSADRHRWGAGVKYESKWTVRAEYMWSHGAIVTNARSSRHSDAWYATVGAPLFKNFKLYGRWDCYRDGAHWNPSAANEAYRYDGLKTDWGLSANYFLGKNLIFQLNYTFTDNRALKGDRYYNVWDVQVTARF